MQSEWGAARARIRPRWWIGVIAVVVYIAVAAGLGTLVDIWLGTDTGPLDYALSHIPLLVPLIAVGVVFVARAGWNGIVWRVPADSTKRHAWLWAFPVLLSIVALVQLISADWSQWAIGGVVLALAVTALIGFGEELYFRGILRSTIRVRHGETLTLLVTSLAFGVAHSFASFFSGLDAGFILFQVLITALDGAAYYGVVRATGRLWPAIVLHALTDFSLTIGDGGFGGPVSSAAPSPLIALPQAVVWILLIALLISSIRQDRQSRTRALLGKRLADPGESRSDS